MLKRCKIDNSQVFWTLLILAKELVGVENFSHRSTLVISSLFSCRIQKNTRAGKGNLTGLIPGLLVEAVTVKSWLTTENGESEAALGLKPNLKVSNKRLLN